MPQAGAHFLLPYLHGRVGDDGRRLGVEGLAKLHHVQPQRTERLLIRKGTAKLLNHASGNVRE